MKKLNADFTVEANGKNLEIEVEETKKTDMEKRIANYQKKLGGKEDE